MYGRAIHWAAILDIIWPNFNSIDNYFWFEVMYLVVNDPDDLNHTLSIEFYTYVANMIAMFWEIQPEQYHPEWEWEISMDDDPEMTLELEIK